MAYEQYLPNFNNNSFNGNVGSASDTLNQARSSAMPSPESLNTAAARVRSRLSGVQSANEQDIRNRMSNRGVSNSGLLQNNLTRNRLGTTSAYGDAFAQLEIDFANRQQQGSQILSDIGGKFGNLGLGLGSLGSDLYLGQNRLYLDRYLGDQSDATDRYGINKQLEGTRYTADKTNDNQQVLIALINKLFSR